MKSIVSICAVLVLGTFFASCSSEQQTNEEKKPRVSIITSVSKGDEFIDGFLKDTVRQTIFPESELILINTNEKKKTIIEEYMNQHPNIKYYQMDDDTGLYGIYNQGIKMASADLVAYANIQDRRNPTFLEEQVKTLEEQPNIDLVYSDYLITYNPNETWENNHYRYVVNTPDFSPSLMYLSLPGPQPVWRKQMHKKYGWFDTTFSHAGNWEFWCRAASKGSKFAKINGVSGLYYSTEMGPKDKEESKEEGQRIAKTYHQFWNH